MRTDRIDLTYRLHFLSPFHLGTGLRAGLVHRAITRDHEGFLYVPGSTMKGALRNHATWLATALGRNALEPPSDGYPLHEFTPEADIITLIFGSRFRPGTLYFDDATMIAEDRQLFEYSVPGHKLNYLASQVSVRGQVSLSRLSGTARRGFLYSSEYGIADLRFAGRVYGQLSGVPLALSDDPTITYSLLLLLAAFASIHHLGGQKSSGAGRIACQITGLAINDQPRIPSPPAGPSPRDDQQPAEIQNLLERIPDFEYYDLCAEEDGS